MFEPQRRAAHRAGHQRGRDLAHGAGHPLRDRRRHARVKRYSYRNKVEQLQVEPSARPPPTSAPGVAGASATASASALRREGFRRPAAFHRPGDPALLAGRRDPAHEVAGLGNVEDFPSSSRRRARAIADGYQLLQAGRGRRAQRAHPIGRELAKLPLDPRVGRMILEARDRCAHRGAGSSPPPLSGQDVRDRPQEQQQAADRRTRSSTTSVRSSAATLKLWKWLEQGRRARSGSHKLSSRKQPLSSSARELISPRRVREWRDIHAQLHTVVAEHGWRLNARRPPTSRCISRCSPGCSATSAASSEDEDWYLGARHPFHRHPGHACRRSRGAGSSPPSWSRPRACSAAASPPSIRLDPGSPRTSSDAAARAALGEEGRRGGRLERATLYGIVVYNNRRVNFGNVDAKAAREIFIREASGQPAAVGQRGCPSSPHNRKLIAQVEELEHKSRRQDVLVDDELIHAFYDQQIPAEGGQRRDAGALVPRGG